MLFMNRALQHALVAVFELALAALFGLEVT